MESDLSDQNLVQRYTTLAKDLIDFWELDREDQNEVLNQGWGEIRALKELAAAPSPPTSRAETPGEPSTRTILQIDVPSWISYVKVAESPDGSCALVFSRSAPMER
jgi:hypothetical protein